MKKLECENEPCSLKNVSEDVLIYAILPFLDIYEMRNFPIASKRFHQLFLKSLRSRKIKKDELFRTILRKRACWPLLMILLRNECFNRKYLDRVMGMCCQKGIIDGVKFLSEHVDYGTMNVMQAAIFGHHEIVEYFICELGMDPNHSDYPGGLLEVACRQGHVGVLEVLLKDGRVDFTNVECLLNSCRHPKVVEFMLQQEGVDPTARAFYGGTSLSSACRRGYVETVKLMVCHPLVKHDKKLVEESLKLARYNEIRIRNWKAGFDVRTRVVNLDEKKTVCGSSDLVEEKSKTVLQRLRDGFLRMLKK